MTGELCVRPWVVDEVIVGSGAETAEFGGDTCSRAFPTCIRSSSMVPGRDCGREPDAGSMTQISGCRVPSRLESGRIKNIFSRCMKPSPIFHRSGANVSMGCDFWGSDLSKTGHAISRQRERTNDSKYSSTFFATSYASVLRVIGLWFFFQSIVGIFCRGQCVTIQPERTFLPELNY